MANENISVLAGGIVCDNENCDYEDNLVKTEDCSDWVGKKCPECGDVLLTEEDYKTSKALFRVVELVNMIPFKKNPEKEEGTVMRVKVHNGIKVEEK